MDCPRIAEMIAADPAHDCRCSCVVGAVVFSACGADRYLPPLVDGPRQLHKLVPRGPKYDTAVFNPLNLSRYGVSTFLS